jgi:hypothetical protein
MEAPSQPVVLATAAAANVQCLQFGLRLLASVRENIKGRCFQLVVLIVALGLLLFPLARCSPLLHCCGRILSDWGAIRRAHWHDLVTHVRSRDGGGNDDDGDAHARKTLVVAANSLAASCHSRTSGAPRAW